MKPGERMGSPRLVIRAIGPGLGAFGLTASSRDAVLVSSLPPGSYTVQVTGGTTGVVLVEVYEAP